MLFRPLFGMIIVSILMVWILLMFMEEPARIEPSPTPDTDTNGCFILNVSLSGKEKVIIYLTGPKAEM